MAVTYTEIGETLFRLLGQSPGLPTAAVHEHVSSASSDLLSRVLRENFKQVDDGWFRAGDSTDYVAAGSAHAASDATFLAALSEFLSAQPRTTEEIEAWYRAGAAAPPCQSLWTLLEENFLCEGGKWRVPRPSERVELNGRPLSAEGAHVCLEVRRRALAALQCAGQPLRVSVLKGLVFGEESGLSLQAAMLRLLRRRPEEDENQVLVSVLRSEPDVRRYDSRTFGLTSWGRREEAHYLWQSLAEAAEQGDELRLDEVATSLLAGCGSEGERHVVDRAIAGYRTCALHLLPSDDEEG